MTEQQFIIRKGGYYYRPNAQGYTSSLLEAGRYPETEAMAHMEHCDPGEITIFPAPAVPASPTLPQDIAATAERIVLEHIAASLDIDGSSAGTRLDMLAFAIATALEIERAAAAPRHHVVGSEALASIAAIKTALAHVKVEAWEVDSEKMDDLSPPHHEYALFNPESHRLCGTENADAEVGMVHTDGPDEDGFFCDWNEPSRRRMEFIAACNPQAIANLIAALDAATENRS